MPSNSEMILRKVKRSSICVMLQRFAEMIACLIIFQETLSAQEIEIERFQLFSNSQGLPSNFISDIIQDEQGYIWIASDDGLVRYDGYTFKVFRNLSNDSSSIQCNAILKLAVDRKGNIWYGSYDGRVGYFNSQARKFKNFNGPGSGLPSGEVYTIFVDSKGKIWITMFRYGLFCFDESKKQFFHVGNLPYIDPIYKRDSTKYLNLNSIYNIHEDKQGLFWLATQDGLYVFDPVNLQFNVMRDNTYDPLKAQRNDLYLCLAPDSTNGYWLGGWSNGLSHYNIHTKEWKRYESNSNNKRDNIRYIRWKSPTELWINTDDGWGVFDIKKKKFFFPKLGDQTFACYKTLRDASNVFWIATSSGIFKYLYDTSMPHFEKVAVMKPYQNNIFSTGSFYHDIVNRKLYFGTVYADGFHIRNIDKGTEVALKVGASMNIHDVENDNEDSLWIASETCVYLLQKKNQELIKFFKPHDSGVTNPRYPFFYRLKRSTKGDLWMGSLGAGIYRVNLKTKKLYQYLNGEVINGIEEDRLGRVWIITPSGLKLFSYENQSFQNVYSIANDSTSLSSNNLTCITRSSNGDIWIGTSENGLCQYKNGSPSIRFTRWTIQDGLPSDVIYTCKSSPNGAVWAASPSSIFSVDPVERKIRSYRVSLMQNDMKLYCDSENTIFIEAFGGFYIFYPHRDTVKQVPPQVVINSIKSFDKEIPFGNDSSSSTVRLNYDQNFIAFEYAALHFKDPSKNQYAYKLEGVDKNWVNAGNRRYVSYNNLQPAQYIFKVKAANAAGLWNEKQVQIKVIIDPPFWQTWFFKLFIFLIVLAIIFGLYSIKASRIAGLAKIRKKISQDLHDDMGSNLSTINILSNVVMNELSNSTTVVKVNEMVKKISELSIGVMESVDEIVWSIDPQQDSFEKIISRMRQLGAQLEDQNISFSFVADGNIAKRNLDLSKRNDFYLIYKEAITNIAKYAKCKKVFVNLSASKNSLRMIVEDDGIGFEPEKLMSGNGLQNMRARSRNLKGEITIWSELYKGSRIELEFPV